MVWGIAIEIAKSVVTRDYTLFPTETCVWEQPYCEPTYEFKRVMTKYSRNLPPPTRKLVTLPPSPSPSSPKITSIKTERQTTSHTPTKIATTQTTQTNNGIAEEQTDVECKIEDNGGSF